MRFGLILFLGMFIGHLLERLDNLWIAVAECRSVVFGMMFRLCS